MKIDSLLLLKNVNIFIDIDASFKALHSITHTTMHKSLIELETERLGKAESEVKEIEKNVETLPILPSMPDEAAEYAAPLRWYAEIRS